MDSLELDTIEEPKTRKVQFGAVWFEIKYASPRMGRKFYTRMAQAGICRGKGDQFDIAAGREMAFFTELAREYIIGWGGNIKPEGTPYTPEGMAKVLANHGGILNAIKEAITEDEAFFGSNGNGQPTS